VCLNRVLEDGGSLDRGTVPTLVIIIYLGVYPNHSGGTAAVGPHESIGALNKRSMPQSTLGCHRNKEINFPDIKTKCFRMAAPSCDCLPNLYKPLEL
jgi:hypothetical protein